MSEQEKNKELARRYFEDLWSNGELSRIEDYVHPTFYQHHPRNRDEDLVDPAALRSWLSALQSQIGQAALKVTQLFAERDYVIVHATGSGIYRPMNQRIHWTTTAHLRIVDQRIAESWVISDTLGVLQQVGLVRKLG